MVFVAPADDVDEQPERKRWGGNDLTMMMEHGTVVMVAVHLLTIKISLTTISAAASTYYMVYLLLLLLLHFIVCCWDWGCCWKDYTTTAAPAATTFT